MNGTASRPARPVSLTTVTVAPEEFPSGKPFIRLPRLVDPHAASFPPSWQENRLSTRKGPHALVIFDAVRTLLLGDFRPGRQNTYLIGRGRHPAERERRDR